MNVSTTAPRHTHRAGVLRIFVRLLSLCLFGVTLGLRLLHLRRRRHRGPEPQRRAAFRIMPPAASIRDGHPSIDAPRSKQRGVAGPTRPPPDGETQFERRPSRPATRPPPHGATQLEEPPNRPALATPGHLSISSSAAPPRQLHRRARLRLAAALVPLGVFGVTVGLRLFHLREAYDVFLDESIYSRIAAGAAVDGRLVFGAYPFYLHGPLSFYLQAFVIHLFGIGGTAIHVIYSLRTFNVLISGAIAVLVFTIVRSVASRSWGLIGAALFAFDPFIVSFDSRLFIETLATLWVLLGFYVLLPLAAKLTPDDHAWRARAPRRRAVICGFLFGLALLTKETSAPLYVLPLLWCIARGSPVRRSSAATALITAALTYVPYPLIAVLTGGGGQFVEQKFSGVERLLGIVQATGFNRPGAPSFLSRVSADLGTFLMTYILIALGAVAAVWLYRRGSPRQRLLAIWGFGALAMLAFQTTQGTIEEQMFYYLVVPSIVVVATAGSLVGVKLRSSPRRSWAIVLVLLAIGGFDLATWVGTHTRRDTAIASAVGWMQSNVPAGSRVAPLADGIQFLLPDYDLLFNPEAGDVSPGQLRAAGTQLVVTSSLQAEEGYSAASPALISWLRLHARERFTARGSSAGTVVIWQLGPLPPDAPPGPQRLSPRAPISVGAPTYRG
jgi:4-amino-4-deoxy-L-arabinose transferase-like glycosyltransferase